jgi:NAD(P)-dependent dehydrogenase (short-subunit alcohol dehydrogenase family)
VLHLVSIIGVSLPHSPRPRVPRPRRLPYPHQLIVIRSGLGQSTAIAFAKHGVTKLALADVNLAALEESNAALKESFPDVQILTLHLDVRDAVQVKEGITQAAAEFGRLDIAINNAGTGGSGRQTHEIEDDEWMKVVDVNLLGVYRCQKEELGIMVNQEYHPYPSLLIPLCTNIE